MACERKSLSQPEVAIKFPKKFSFSDENQLGAERVNQNYYIKFWQ